MNQSTRDCSTRTPTRKGLFKLGYDAADDWQSLRIDVASEQILEQAMQRQGLSARAYDRILKVSRTIADLEGCEAIGPTHVSEAVGYRSLECTYWSDLKPQTPPQFNQHLSVTLVKLRL